MARAAGRARKRYLDWAKQEWKEAPGKLPSTVADPRMQRLETARGCAADGAPSLAVDAAAVNRKRSGRPTPTTRSRPSPRART
eukprot:3371833-Pyramimonas_sp.AAC.1